MCNASCDIVSVPQHGDDLYEAAVSASVGLQVGRGSASDGMVVPNAHVLQLKVCEVKCVS